MVEAKKNIGPKLVIKKRRRLCEYSWGATASREQKLEKIFKNEVSEYFIKF